MPCPENYRDDSAMPCGKNHRDAPQGSHATIPATDDDKGIKIVYIDGTSIKTGILRSSVINRGVYERSVGAEPPQMAAQTPQRETERRPAIDPAKRATTPSCPTHSEIIGETRKPPTKLGDHP
jgi:hypothetical protein